MNKPLSYVKLLMVAVVLLLSTSASQAVSWRERSELAGPARTGAVGFAIGSKAYIGTGQDASSGYLNDFWEYDGTTNLWTQKASLPGAARAEAVGFAINGKGYIGTGQSGASTYLNDFWEYNPANNSWTQKANFPGTARAKAVEFASATLGYVGTGRDATGLTADMHAFNPALNTWSAIAAFPGSAREDAAAFFASGVNVGVVATGSDANGYTNTAYKFDPALGTWTSIANYAGNARAGAVGMDNTNIGLIGTGQTATGLTNDFYQYSVTDNLWSSFDALPGEGRTNAVGFRYSAPGGLTSEAYMVGTGTTISGVSKTIYDNSFLITSDYTTVTGLSASTLCANQPIDVTFTVSSNFNTQNTFTAFLSDATGSFASPTAIGTLAGGSGGTINAVLPANLPAGTGYRIMVKGDSPSSGANDVDNGYDLPTGLAGGTYTLNQQAAPSATNFINLAAISSALGSGCGITGPVTIDVVPGTGPYFGQQLVLGEIAGSSATNTVTINGNGETVTFCSNDPLNRDVIRLNGTDNVTIIGFNISATCSYGWGVHVMGDVSNVNIMANNITVNASLSSFIGNMAGIVAANSFTNPAAPAGNINGLNITTNTITNGYHGIRVNGASTTNMAMSVSITDNEVNNATQYGIYLINAMTPMLNRNLVNMNTTLFARSTGIWISQVEGGLMVTRNQVINAGAMGMFLNRVNTTSTTRGQVANNMIGGGFRYPGLSYALSVNYSNNLDVYYNSTNLDAGIGASASFTGTGHNVMNNSFAYTGGGAGYAMANPGNSFLTLNYNNYYSNGTKFVFFGMDRATLQDLRDAPGLANHDLNSMAENPMYSSPTDLHIAFSSPLIDQGTDVYVTDDFDGLPRSMPTDIGADEYGTGVRLANKGGVAAQVYPNPFRNELTVELTGAAGTVNMVLVDVTGRQVAVQTVAVEEGTTRSNIRVSDALPQGVYMLQVTQGDATGTYRVVKH